MNFPWHQTTWEVLLRKTGELPHALLLHGARGIGKRALAERFAQYLLCEARGAEAACDRCEACRWYLAGHHPDLRRLEPEALAVESGEERGSRARPSNEIKVEQVRALADFLNIGSHRGRLRVALVHPAEALNVHAANALLKSLEEPPPGAVFVLVSHRPARLLPTLRSRCVALAIPLPPNEKAHEWLAAQGLADAGRWLAFAGGAPLRALEDARGERGAVIAALLKALAARDVQALSEQIDTRESLELLAELLQKAALDRALGAMGAEPKYGVLQRRGVRDAQGLRDWLAFARLMGRNQALVRHPLNPKLFAAQMLAAMPKG